MIQKSHSLVIIARTVVFPAVLLMGTALTATGIANADVITPDIVVPDDDDDFGSPGVLPAGDPTLTLTFVAPALTAGKKELGDGWGRLSVTFDQALTGAMFKIPPVCPDFVNVPAGGFSNGKKTVLVGPGEYKIPVGNTVTLTVSSNADVKFVSATWVSKKKLDDPNNTPGTPTPEPATFLLLGTAAVCFTTRRVIASKVR